MWSISFLMGMMFSLGVSANTCDIKNVEGIVALVNTSPEEKHYREVNNQLQDTQYADVTRSVRPEFSSEFSVDKDNSKNKEITVELLFSINDYLKAGALKSASAAQRDLKKLEYDRESQSKLLSVVGSLFKISQNVFFQEKIEGLIGTLKSSENIYKSRAIRSREDEIILSSLGLLKNHLQLKKSKIEDQIFEDRQNLVKFNISECDVDYKVMMDIIGKMALENYSDERLLSFQELKLKSQIVQSTSELETRRTFENLKVGPSFTKEKTDSSDEYRFGVILSFDLPTFSNSNQNYIAEVKKLATLQESRGVREANFEKNVLIQRFNKNARALQSLPTVEKLEEDVRKIKKSFDSGVISPLTYLDSYRSYIDFLDVSEEVRFSVFESYFKLRGLYVENINY